MKKLITIAVAALIGIGAFAAERPTCYTNKQGKVYTYLTNAVETAQKLIVSGPVVSGYAVAPTIVYEDDWAAVDAVLATATNVVLCQWKEYPNGTQRYLDIMRSRGQSVGMMTYSENEVLGDKSYRKDPVRIVASLDMINWNFYGTPWATLNSAGRLERIKKSIVSEANKSTKAKLRSEGKSFVVKDGVNPVQERLDALTAALDAPYFAGLEVACTNCGINVSSDFRKHFPTPAQIAQLKDDVFMGRKDFTDENKVYLMMALGVTEYNTFVKAYNGDEQ